MKSAGRLRHRLAKLGAMSPRELCSRAAYEAFTTNERRRHRRGQLAPPDRLRKGLDAALARRGDWQHALSSSLARARFFQGVESGDAVRSLFADRYAEERRQANRIAHETARGEVSFFGRSFSLGAPVDWHADPVTGSQWPRKYHRDVPVHGGDVGFGDVKYVWEINRHQYFVDLAKSAFLGRSAAHAESLHALLRDWMGNVPYAAGAPWACALEPAFRAWSWLWAYHLVRAVDMVTRDEHALWLTGFYDHGRFLYRHLERYSSPYNHLIGEASALFALGVLFPCFRDARAWIARGRQVLESTVASQFHSDGGSVEQSTFYHHATLGFYMLAAVLGRRNDCDLAADVWTAIERGIAFSAALTQPNGRLPRIGGADDGKPIRMEHLPFWDFRPYHAIGAVLFSRPDFKFVGGRFWEDALWLLGPEGAESFDRLQSREPPRSAALEASGYYVARSGWSSDADYVCFDCGPQAAGLSRGDVPSAAHGHADCLSVVIALGGREVLVDPGFFCYNGDPRWEVDFRRTIAHNTIAVDGKDQAQHVSKMAWIRTFSARPEGWSAEDGWARGSHDGYVRNAGGVTHRRTVWLRPGGYVVIRDELTGATGQEARAVFQFAPGKLVVNGSCALHEDRYELAWACTSDVKALTSCGGPEPGDGWVAPSLGVREAAPRLELVFALPDSPVILLTVLADRNRSPCPFDRRAVTTARTGDAVTATVAVGGFIDEVVSATGMSQPGSGPMVTIQRKPTRAVGQEHGPVAAQVAW